jgi:hypothetical protein
MGVGGLAISLALMLYAADKIEVFGHSWSVPVASDWLVEQPDSAPVLFLRQERGPLPAPRRPTQFAMAQTPDFRHVTVSADVMPLGRSIMIVFAYHDDAHFDYAHLSIDSGSAQPHHNGIFHVYGGERVRISSERGPAAFPANQRWYHVELTHDSETGAVSVKVDGKPVPALEAVDLSLGAGKVGLGSFDETARFRNVHIRGGS